MQYNNNTPQNPKDLLKVTIIIHMALTIGQVLFAIVVIFMLKNLFFSAQPSNDVFFYIVPLMAIVGVALGSFFYKQLITQAVNKPTLKEKLVVYQTASIIRWALAEGASLFGIVVCLITSNLFYITISGLIIVYFVWMRPTQQKLEDDLQLSYEEKTEFV